MHPQMLVLPHCHDGQWHPLRQLKIYLVGSAALTKLAPEKVAQVYILPIYKIKIVIDQKTTEEQ